MKQAWSDLKSFVTIVLTLTLVVLIIIVAIKGNWDIFQLVFTLFSSVTASVITYYFAKKKEEQQAEIEKLKAKIEELKKGEENEL